MISKCTLEGFCVAQESRWNLNPPKTIAHREADEEFMKSQVGHRSNHANLPFFREPSFLFSSLLVSNLAYEAFNVFLPRNTISKTMKSRI